MASGPKKVELSKPPRYIDTRVADIYPVTKPGDRLKILSSKDKFKNKDLPEDHDHPQQIDPDHDVGSNVGMEDDAHDDTDTNDSDGIADVDGDDDDHDDHDHDGDHYVEAVAGSNQ